MTHAHTMTADVPHWIPDNLDPNSHDVVAGAIYMPSWILHAHDSDSTNGTSDAADTRRHRTNYSDDPQAVATNVNTWIPNALGLTAVTYATIYAQPPLHAPLPAPLPDRLHKKQKSDAHEAGATKAPRTVGSPAPRAGGGQ